MHPMDPDAEPEHECYEPGDCTSVEWWQLILGAFTYGAIIWRKSRKDERARQRLKELNPEIPDWPPCLDRNGRQRAVNPFRDFDEDGNYCPDANYIPSTCKSIISGTDHPKKHT